MAVAIDKGYKIFGYRNLRTEKLLESEFINKKFLSLGNGVDICVNEKLNVVFLHLGRGTHQQTRPCSLYRVEWHTLPNRRLYSDT